MKKVIFAVAMAALVAFTGCNNSTPGGSGTKDKEKDNRSIKDRVGTSKDTFKLSLPTLSTSLKQGESKEVTIGISRGTNFDEDVTLKFDGLPSGVTLDPAAPVIKKSDKDARISFKAKDEAAVGDFTVKVTGHPASGDDAYGEMKVTVASKK